MSILPRPFLVRLFWFVLISFIIVNIMPLPISGLSSIDVLGIRFDHFLHGLVFFVIGALYIQSRSDRQHELGVYIAIPLIVVIAIAAEALHYIIPWRSFNWNDMAGNVIGALIGMFVGWMFRRRSRF